MKDKKIGIIIGVIAAVIVIGIAGFFFLGKDSKEAVLNEYVEYINKKEYENMYSLISSDSKQNWNKEDFVTRVQNIYEGIDANNITMDITDEKKTDAGTEFTYNMTLQSAAGKLSFDNSVVVKEEDGDAKIVWDSTQIFPDLTDSDKVSVNVTSGERGSILDRNGEYLATQGTVYQVGFVAGSMKDEQDSISKAAEVLDVSKDSITQSLSASWVQEGMFVPIKSISENTYQDIKDDWNAIDGSMAQQTTGRVYPYGEMTAHLTGYIQTVTEEDLKNHEGEGYTSTSMIGKTGLESIYESTLRATDGCSIYIIDEKGNQKTTVAQKQAQNGKDVKLTIDMNAQKIAYEQVKDDAGSAVIMDSKTGEMLAMVSMPAYDPNDFVLGMDSKSWEELNNNPLNPLLNRYISAYCPGSAFKAITGTIALDSKTITSDTTFEKTDKWQKDSRWGDNYVTTTQSYDEPSNLHNAIVYSDNIVMAQIADKIGAKTFSSYLDKIGFGKKIDFPFTLATSTYGDELDNDQKLAATGYGQGDLLLTPIHLNALYTAYVNDGSIRQPYLVYEDGKTKTLVENAYSADAANTMFTNLKDAMDSYGDNPTNAGGKTSTAQVKEGKEEIGWLCAVNDDIAVTVMIDDTKEIGQSHYVIPKVQAILSNYTK